MIASLRGTISRIAGSRITLEVQGVGYEVLCSSSCLSKLEVGAKVLVIVHTIVREDEITLYGLESELERQVFSLLLSVQGVGPRSALEIISRIENRELLRAIGTGNVAKLQGIKGIGRKISERIVVELKDKVAAFAADYQGQGLLVERQAVEPFEEAIAAMQALGFARKDAERAVHSVAEQQESLAGVSSGQIVKEALRFV